MKSVLITGGTGSLGHELVRQMLSWPQDYARCPERLVIYSRDEQKQEAMRHAFGDHQALRFFIGDVRDADRLAMAMRGIDTVIHAAALKIVPKCEYDPEEAAKTNVGGAMNVIKACIQTNVLRAVLTSTDKAVNPINLYGATKLCAEKLFVAANHLSGGACIFSVVRYGNVVNSRGSVIPFWRDIAARGDPLPITLPDMTRFWITLDQAGDLVLSMLETMQGGEIFVPRLPAFRLVDLAACIATVGTTDVGIRPGEKIHETLVSADECRSVKLYGDLFTISPPWAPYDAGFNHTGYSSDLAPHLTVDELRKRLAS